MDNLILQLKRMIATSLAAIMGVTCFSSAAVFGAAMVATTERADAGRTVVRAGPRGTAVRHRGGYYRPGVGYGSVRRTARRTSRRTARRVTRRHMWALPAGYRVVNRGAYRYYYYGGAYYYPYYKSGRTVYVEVDINGGPPPASEIEIDIDID